MSDKKTKRQATTSNKSENNEKKRKTERNVVVIREEMVDGSEKPRHVAWDVSNFRINWDASDAKIFTFEYFDCVTGKNAPLMLRTPSMRVPFDISDYNNNGVFNYMQSFGKKETSEIAEFYEVWSEICEAFCNYVQDNKAKFFSNGEEMTRDEVKKFYYRNPLQPRKSKKDPAKVYDATLTFKVSGRTCAYDDTVDDEEEKVKKQDYLSIIKGGDITETIFTCHGYLVQEKFGITNDSLQVVRKERSNTSCFSERM
jgi:hypothetical protein